MVLFKMMLRRKVIKNLQIFYPAQTVISKQMSSQTVDQYSYPVLPERKVNQKLNHFNTMVLYTYKKIYTH